MLGVWLFRGSLQWPGDNPVMRAVSAIESGFEGMQAPAQGEDRMKRVLGPYLRSRVTGQIIGLLAALTGLMQLLELLEVTSDVLSRGLGVGGVLHYAVLRLPGEMAIALPLAALLGGMSAFYAMARTREITALRCAGVGLWRILLYLAPVPVILALLQLGLSQVLVPVAERSLKAWWDSTVPLEERPAEPRWVRTSNGVLLFDRNSADGRALLDVRIYQRGSDGLLTQRTKAQRADWTGSGWQLRQVQDLQHWWSIDECARHRISGSGCRRDPTLVDQSAARGCDAAGRG